MIMLIMLIIIYSTAWWILTAMPSATQVTAGPRARAKARAKTEAPGRGDTRRTMRCLMVLNSLITGWLNHEKWHHEKWLSVSHPINQITLVYPSLTITPPFNHLTRTKPPFSTIYHRVTLFLWVVCPMITRVHPPGTELGGHHLAARGDGFFTPPTGSKTQQITPWNFQNLRMNGLCVNGLSFKH